MYMGGSHMNYTPVNLENLILKKSFRGYNKSQVNEVMSKIVDDYQNTISEIEELRSRVSVLDETVNHYKTIEEAMQHCLIIAQKTSDEMKTNASHQAQNIVNEAQLTANKLVNEANCEVNRIKTSYDDMKNKIFTFKSKAEALLGAQLDVLRQLGD